MVPDSIALTPHGVRLSYRVEGDPDAPAVVLISGLGQQHHAWPAGLVAGLVAQGRRVVTFDNRDAGCSTHLDFEARPWSVLTGRFHPEQYRLADMADDVVGLLDHLELDQADLVGMSMGGMIAQEVAARAPERVRTLTSVMSTTGAPRVGRPARSTWRRMAFAVPPRDPAAAGEAAVAMFRHIGSAGFPFDEAAVRAGGELDFRRDPDRAKGVTRQLCAIFASGDRSASLAAVTAPTLVVHGDVDLMVDPSGGRATARAIRGARLLTIAGMGHDLPRGAWPILLRAWDEHLGAPASCVDTGTAAIGEVS